MNEDEVLGQIMGSLTVDVVVAGRALGIGRNASYRAAATGDIPTIRIGGSLRVATSWLRERLGLREGQQRVAA